MVNHMCHFPMGSGASRLSSSIQEHHDMNELEVNDLKQEIFFSSNIQVCNGEESSGGRIQIISFYDLYFLLMILHGL